MRRPGLRWLFAAVGALAAFSLPVLVFVAWERSRLPGTYNVTELGIADLGGGPPPAHAGHGAGGDGRHGAHDPRAVSHLKEDSAGEPDFRATLTARTGSLTLASRKQVDVLAFDGRVPGPELRIRQHDLVEITLVNEDVDEGVTIHWHGLHVPNAEDGVAGVTQDAVMPGERYTYRFRATQAGTYWYHSHQAPVRQVKQGLYGVLVVEPADEPAARTQLDLALTAHVFGRTEVLGASDRLERRAVEAGTDVRLRLVNTDDFAKRFVVTGTPFRVLAIDGVDLHEPTPLTGTTLELAAGGRYDLGFTMPGHPVRLDLLGASAGLLLAPGGRGEAAAGTRGPLFDPLSYGSPKPTPFDASRFDRTFEVDLGQKIGFSAGAFGKHWTINGRVHAEMPALVVREGDLVKLTISSSTRESHPMHLHGHHMLVLSRNGEPASGSPWWVDSLDVKNGETYEVAFRADNPGLWMFHCHNQIHAAEGLGTHLVYEGVTTPFLVGGRAGNEPE